MHCRQTDIELVISNITQYSSTVYRDCYGLYSNGQAASLRAAFRRAAFVLSFIYLLFIVIFDTSLRSSLLRFSFLRLFHPGGTITLRYVSFTVVWYPLLSFLINTESRLFVCPEGPSLLL